LIEIVQECVYAKLNVTELETDSEGECIKGSERAFMFVSEDDQDIVSAIIEPRMNDAMMFGQTFVGA
jgi:hypothetical protein